MATPASSGAPEGGALGGGESAWVLEAKAVFAERQRPGAHGLTSRQSREDDRSREQGTELTLQVPPSVLSREEHRTRETRPPVSMPSDQHEAWCLKEERGCEVLAPKVPLVTNARSSPAWAPEESSAQTRQARH